MSHSINVVVFGDASIILRTRRCLGRLLKFKLAVIQQVQISVSWPVGWGTLTRCHISCGSALASFASLNHSCSSRMPLCQAPCCPLYCWVWLLNADVRGFPLAQASWLRWATDSYPTAFWARLSYHLHWAGILNSDPALWLQSTKQRNLGNQKQHFISAFPAKTSKTSPYICVVTEASWLCLWSHCSDLHGNTCNRVGRQPGLFFNYLDNINNIDLGQGVEEWAQKNSDSGSHAGLRTAVLVSWVKWCFPSTDLCPPLGNSYFFLASILHLL